MGRDYSGELRQSARIIADREATLTQRDEKISNLEARIAAVESRHRSVPTADTAELEPSKYDLICADCECSHPCPTFRILRGEE